MKINESQKAILHKSDVFQDCYRVPEGEWEISILADFLTSDCYCFGTDKYVRWALDPQNNSTSGNITFLRKKEQRICLASDMNHAEPPYLYLSADNFVEILNVWKKIVETMPQEVHLIMENGRVRTEVIKGPA
jgi:hypothetical protein